MSKLHLVFGGRVKDPRTLDFDMSTIDVVGIYDSYAAAEDAWRAAAQRTVDDAVQLIGGQGVLAGHAVDRLYRSVRALRIYEGTTEIQQLIIAAELLKGGETTAV